MSEFTIGAELEFYLLDENGGVIADLESGKFPQKHFEILPEYAGRVAAFYNDVGVEIKKESGPAQLEVSFAPETETVVLAEKISQFRDLAHLAAKKQGLSISYHPKPFAEYTGSALHVHFCHQLFDPLGLVHNNGVVSPKIDPNNDYLLWAIGGVLARMKQDLPIFLPNEFSRERLVPFMNAPTKICWGKNNRSVAVRIPDSKPKRLEHRVAGSDSNAEKVIEAVVNAALMGIEQQISPPEPVYGNAWEDKYQFEYL